MNWIKEKLWNWIPAIIGLLIFIVACSVLGGCVSDKLVHKEFTFERTAFGTNLSLSELTVTDNHDGTFSIGMKGTVSDNVAAMQAISAAVIQGAGLALGTAAKTAVAP